jgi:hypothetical protein
MPLTEQPLSLDEFLAAIQPELKREVDERILAQPPADRQALMRHREQIVDRYVDATRIPTWSTGWPRRRHGCGRSW